MRCVALAATLLVAVSAGPATAKICDGPNWYRRVQSWVQLLAAGQMTDREVIAPPPNIDPKMALAPPGPHGAMRIIPPPGGGVR